MMWTSTGAKPRPLPYVTEHPFCRTVIAAVAEGLDRKPEIAASLAWKPEPAIVYGILRGCADIIRKCTYAGLDWWHIDLGYWGRGHFDGYYRLSRNGFQDPPTNCAPATARIELPELLPWKDGKGPIVICPPTLAQVTWHPTLILDPEDWTRTVEDYIRSVTNRQVVIRSKTDINNPLPDDPYCVVTYASNIAVDALRHGTPAISLGPGILNAYSPPLSDINDPDVIRIPDRELLFKELSWGQFTLDEFRRGIPWEYAR